MPSSAPKLSRSYGGVRTSGVRSELETSTSKSRFVGWKDLAKIERPKLTPLVNPQIVVEVVTLPSGATYFHESGSNIVDLATLRAAMAQSRAEYLSSDEWQTWIEANGVPGFSEQAVIRNAQHEIDRTDRFIEAWMDKSCSRCLSTHMEQLTKTREAKRTRRMTVSR